MALFFLNLFILPNDFNTYTLATTCSTEARKGARTSRAGPTPHAARCRSPRRLAQAQHSASQQEVAAKGTGHRTDPGTAQPGEDAVNLGTK